MDDFRIVAICWMLVGVTIVCIFAAKVSIERDRQQWSQVQVPAPKARTPYWPLGLGK